MRQEVVPITANVEVARDMHVLRLASPAIARQARPGQFLYLRCAQETDPLLRRPMSILRVVRDIAGRPEQIEVLLDVVGRGTKILSRLGSGETIDVIGPLGQPFTALPKTKRALLVGGGIGVAPLVALAEDLLLRGAEVTLLAEFRSAAKVYPTTLLPPEVEYVVATNDGSLGHAGLVVELVGQYRDWADQVFACGPVPMLKELARLDLAKSLPVQVALEEHMGCAMGVCLGCVVPTKKGLQRVCRDGPVFDIKDMRWT